MQKAEPLRCLALNDLYEYGTSTLLSEAILAAKDGNYAYQIALLQLSFEFRWCCLGLKGSLISGIKFFNSCLEALAISRVRQISVKVVVCTHLTSTKLRYGDYIVSLLSLSPPHSQNTAYRSEM